MLGYIISAATSLTLIYKFSKIGRYFVKFTTLFFGCIVVTLPWIPFMLFRGQHYRNVFMPSRGCILIARLLGVQFELRGMEHVNMEKGGVVLVNHQSALDIVVCSVLSLKIGKFATVVKKEVFYVFPFGWLWNTIYLDRKSKQAGRQMISQESKEIQEKQVKVVIYPEGTRHQGNELLPFKKGAFHIALETNCDIYPVVVSKYHFLDSRTYKFDKGHCVIEILPPISTKGMQKSDIDNLIKTTRDLMQKKYEELSAETKLK